MATTSDNERKHSLDNSPVNLTAGLEFKSVSMLEIATGNQIAVPLSTVRACLDKQVITAKPRRKLIYWELIVSLMLFSSNSCSFTLICSSLVSFLATFFFASNSLRTDCSHFRVSASLDLEILTDVFFAKTSTTNSPSLPFQI